MVGSRHTFPNALHTDLLLKLYKKVVRKQYSPLDHSFSHVLYNYIHAAFWFWRPFFQAILSWIMFLDGKVAYYSGKKIGRKGIASSCCHKFYHLCINKGFWKKWRHQLEKYFLVIQYRAHAKYSNTLVYRLILCELGDWTLAKLSRPLSHHESSFLFYF